MKIKVNAKLRFGINKAKFLRQRNLELGGRVQQYIDKECLRLMEPYVPFRTGALTRSGQTLTQIGSGAIMYKPVSSGSRTSKSYAARLYYGKRFKFNKSFHKDAGAFWFKRMMKAKKKEILKGACAIAGAKPNSGNTT